ncbi:MAG: RIP metalloprotease RseP [Bacteroidetes bacterium]|nr:MAG: RIP metalloprotease RseP [Bacteroidota bacterium]
MSGLVMAAQLILSFAILITLHELGHFLAARAFGIRVEKFYLFFDAWGFKFFSFKRGDTEYGVGWLPLGGYVKIAGMIDESMDKEAMKEPPKDYEFRSKPAWQRLIVMIAGVTMNVILGIIIYAFVLYNYDKQYLPNSAVTDGIYAYSLGEEVGLQTGDKIIAINGKSFERFDMLLSSRVVFGCKLTVERKGQLVDVTIPDDFYRRTLEAGKGNFIGPYQSNLQVDSVIAGKPAETSGLKRGDRIMAINGNRVFSMESARKMINENRSKPISLHVMRGTDSLLIQPVVSDSGMIGITYHSDYGPYALENYTAGKALSFGASDAFEAITSNIKGLKQIFVGKEKASESLQGPIGIAKIYGGIWDWRRFWTITGLLSMVLAFMNMLPIPALDGGHVVFLLFETITQKKLSDKFLERAQVVGMIILLTLMVYATGNDIWKHIIN